MSHQPGLVFSKDVKQKDLGVLPGSVGVRPRSEACRAFQNDPAQRGQGSGCLRAVGLQLLGLVVGDERIDDRLQAALHD
jgi:hypothetical protein